MPQDYYYLGCQASLQHIEHSQCFWPAQSPVDKAPLQGKPFSRRPVALLAATRQYSFSCPGLSCTLNVTRSPCPSLPLQYRLSIYTPNNTVNTVLWCIQHWKEHGAHFKNRSENSCLISKNALVESSRLDDTLFRVSFQTFPLTKTRIYCNPSFS